MKIRDDTKVHIAFWRPAVLAAVVASLALAWLFFSSYPVIDRLRLDGTNSLPPLEAGHQVVQSFRAPEDSLSRIDVMLVRGNATSGLVRFEILDVPDVDKVPENAKALREVTVDVSSLESNSMHRFEFDPIPDSGGNNYAMRLSGYGVVESGGDSLSDGALFLDGQPYGGDMGFAVFHSSGIFGLLARVAPFRPFLLGNRIFFIGLFTIGAVCVGWLLWMIVSSANVDDRGRGGGQGLSNK